ncbi:UDP-N-acetylmuramate--L-alanine ligase [compost metagenome]
MAGKVEPVFVEQMEEMPQAILDAVRPGDVVVTMGAGSIGAVPGQLVSHQQSTQSTQGGQA